jgi:putative redox protein
VPTTTKRISGFQFEIKNGNNQLVSDVALKDGGTDQGMSPHELIESALAACTAITVTMYAQRKGWPLQDIDVQVRITKEGKESEIERRIHFVGNLSQEQHLRLVEIANKCPIHRLLESHIAIITNEF